MCRLSADVQVYLHRDPVDFSAGIDSLALDDALPVLFARNPNVTGVTFPATCGRSAHTSTARDPHVLPYDKAQAAIRDAWHRGEITVDQMIMRIRQISQPQ